jgi:hypothetical protein
MVGTHHEFREVVPAVVMPNGTASAPAATTIGAAHRVDWWTRAARARRRRRAAGSARRGRSPGPPRAKGPAAPRGSARALRREADRREHDQPLVCVRVPTGPPYLGDHNSERRDVHEGIRAIVLDIGPIPATTKGQAEAEAAAEYRLISRHAQAIRPAILLTRNSECSRRGRPVRQRKVGRGVQRICHRPRHFDSSRESPICHLVSSWPPKAAAGGSTRRGSRWSS